MSIREETDEMYCRSYRLMLRGQYEAADRLADKADRMLAAYRAPFEKAGSGPVVVLSEGEATVEGKNG